MANANTAKALADCDNLIIAAQALKARIERTGAVSVYDSHAGLALVNAAYDVIECDALYDMKLDIEHVLCPVETVRPWSSLSDYTKGVAA